MNDTPDPGDEKLREAYTRTSYCARTPEGLIRLRIGSASTQLDRLLELHGVREWAYVSAWNPGSKATPDSDNARRHDDLIRTVRSLGKPFFVGDGVGDDSRWKPEQSVLILGIGEEQAVRLGNEFGQNAVVMGTLGGVPRLRFCRS
jgi:hypothetical protein